LASIRQVSRKSIDTFQSFDVSISELPTLIKMAESAKNSLHIDCRRMVDCYERKVDECHQSFHTELKSFTESKQPPHVSPPSIDKHREHELRAAINRVDAFNSMRYADVLASRKRTLRQLTSNRRTIETDIERLRLMQMNDEESRNDDLTTMRNEIERLEIDITRMRAQIKQWCSSSTTTGTHLQRFVQQ